MSKVRDSNFELLRVISMFWIVLFHVILYIGEIPNKGVSIILEFIQLMIVIHVNLFVLITGYFQSKSTFKQSRIWSLVNATMFYKIIIVIILTCLGIINLNSLELFNDLSIFNIDQYWFIRTYIYLYILSPFINKFIESLDKKSYLNLLIILFCLFSIIPFITANRGFSNNGFTLYNFIYIYLIGAYIKKYPLDKSNILKKCSKKSLQIILFSLFIICPLLNFLLTYASQYLIGINSITDDIFSNFYLMRYDYSHPIVIIQSISFFLLFSLINFKSKIINNVSKLTLGIYLIHENRFIREPLYKITGISDGVADSYSFILYVIIISLIIFVTCGFIEKIRQILFKFIYNRNLSFKIRKKYYNWISAIKINST